MKRVIHIDDADLLEPFTRRVAATGELVFYCVVKRSPELEQATQADTIIYAQTHHRLRSKTPLGTHPYHSYELSLVIVDPA